MRGYYVLIALFALFAWDFAENDANVYWALNAYVDEAMRELHLS